LLLLLPQPATAIIAPKTTLISTLIFMNWSPPPENSGYLPLKLQIEK
jgi:hypothetical protein